MRRPPRRRFECMPPPRHIAPRRRKGHWAQRTGSCRRSCRHGNAFRHTQVRRRRRRPGSYSPGRSRTLRRRLRRSRGWSRHRCRCSYPRICIPRWPSRLRPEGSDIGPRSRHRRHTAHRRPAHRGMLDTIRGLRRPPPLRTGALLPRAARRLLSPVRRPKTTTTEARFLVCVGPGPAYISQALRVGAMMEH